MTSRVGVTEWHGQQCRKLHSGRATQELTRVAYYRNHVKYKRISESRWQAVKKANVLSALNCLENGFPLQSVLHSRLETFHFGLHSTLLRIWYIRSDWWTLTNGSDVMNTTSHRVYQTGEGERGSEVAANDLGRLRIRLYNSWTDPFRKRSTSLYVTSKGKARFLPKKVSAKHCTQRARSCPQFPRSTHGTPGTMTPLLARKTVAFYDSDPLWDPSNNKILDIKCVCFQFREN